MTQRVFDPEAFTRRAAEYPYLPPEVAGMPEDFETWTPEQKRKWHEALAEHFNRKTDPLLAAGAFIPLEDIGRDWDDPPHRPNGHAKNGKEFETAEMRGGGREEQAAPIVLRVFNPADWEGKKAPPRLWIVPDYIPAGTVTLLYADGGTGKSYLKLQIAVARAVAKEWIGLLPEPGRTLVFSTEDDINEMWRRIEGIIPFYGVSMADLGDIRLIDAVGENNVLGLLAKGIIEPTAMYNELDRFICEFKPSLVCLDVLADMFSGSENDRPQVTQFVGLLKKLCRKHDTAILLLAQPSVVGMNTDSGTSGSTGWGNSGRSRLWFKRVKDADGNEPNKDLRTFEGKKNNYGEIGGKFDLEWKDGLFRRIAGPAGFDKLAADRKAEDVFLALLKRFNAQRLPASLSPGKSYAPALFERQPDSQGIKSKDFAAAMDRLLADGKVLNVPEGPPSKGTWRLKLP